MNTTDQFNSDLKLGVNGFGRIGKLTVWHHISRKHFPEIVVNLGREVGGSIHDLVHYLERDSTYGHLANFMYGHKAGPVITDVSEADYSLKADGVRIKFLTKSRNPRDIDWAGEDVRLVVESTGQFLDPTLPADAPKGSCLGHLEAGAEKVIVSAPFKIKDKGAPMPDYAVTTTMGVNHRDYDPRRHKVISNASCTTSCLAHMFKPLLRHFGPKKILTASMTTVHAVTSSQSILDRLPAAGASDLRKTRSAMENIILTSTGAAKTLALVIPEMKQIGFMAESVRIPSVTGSLIILVVNFQDESTEHGIRRDLINGIYQKAAEEDENGYLMYSEQQNVSADVSGAPRAAAIIEGHETHTRTAEINLDLAALKACSITAAAGADTVIRIPVTQAVIYGWYDNEFASYVNLLGDRTVTVAETI